MLSFTEIILTAAVAFAVWYGFRWINRASARAQAKPLVQDKPRGPGRVEDLIACGLCGDYAPAAAAPCARADCPRRR